MKAMIISAGVAMALALSPVAVKSAEFDYGSFDADRDGIVTEPEYNAIGGIFGDYDINADQAIDENEFGAFAEEGWGEENEITAGLFDSWDDDGDRLITSTEWADDEEFGEWDENQSAALEIEEDEGWF